MATNDDAGGQLGNASGFMYSPIINLENASSPALSFEAYYQGFETDFALVSISKDGGVSWKAIALIPVTQDWVKYDIPIKEYVGTKELQIAFEYDDGNVWGFGFAVDNITIFEPKAWDAKLLSIDINDYQEPLKQVTVEGEFFNSGFNAINSYDVYWSDGTNDHKQTISGLDIQFGKSATFTHSVPLILNPKTIQDISVRIENLNGNVDDDVTNNKLSKTITGLSFLPEKKVIVEEATGTWCGWCTRGVVGLKYMEKNYNDTHIGIAIHNNDPMANKLYDEAASFSGFPSSYVNRIGEFDPKDSTLEFIHLQEITKAAPIELGMKATVDTESRKFDVQLFAKSAAQINKKLRFNVVITEDKIMKDKSGYDQANYYAGGGFGKMGGFELLTDPVPASDIVYDHVAREILGGWLGFEGSFPQSIEYDQEVSYTTSYEVPEDFDINHLNIIGMVIDEESGHILNGEKIAVSDIVSSSNDVENISILNVTPNPCSDFVLLQFEMPNSSDVELILADINGKVIEKQNFNKLQGTQNIKYNTSSLAKGIYFVKVQIDGMVITRKVIKS
jgi:hypothetical protein